MGELRAMTGDDVAAGLELCRLAGWNQIAADWQRLLDLAPEGVFVVEDGGRTCATASVIAHGTRTGWIGMILVHPDFRRRGLASALMSRCIETLQSRGVESIKLDATDQGRPVYLKLGFADERPIWRYAGTRPPRGEPDPRVRPIGDGDWEAIARRDEAAFGADRSALLKHLAGEGPSAIVAGPGEAGPTARMGDIRAYGFARPGFCGSYLGPVVAADGESARRVVLALLAELPEGELYWDVLPDNFPARCLVESMGLVVDRKLTRLVLGEKVNAGQVNRVFATAGFELG